MTTANSRRVVPPLLIVGLIAAALVWAAVTRSERRPVPVTSVKRVRNEGVVYLHREEIFLVDRNGDVLALTDDAQHVGDKVLFCESSGLFESRAHGEKFDRYGRYIGGPAATDMDHAEVLVRDGDVYLTGHITESRRRSPFDPSRRVVGPFCADEAEPDEQRPGFFEAI